MTIGEAAKRLKVKQEVAYHLVREKILDSFFEEDTDQRLVLEKSLDDFNRKYVFTSEIAAKIGKERPSVLPVYLTSLGILPHLNPTTDHCRQYLYLRTPELEVLMSNRP